LDEPDHGKRTALPPRSIDKGQKPADRRFVAGVTSIRMADLWPFMWAELVIPFLMELFPQLVTVPAKWFGGRSACRLDHPPSAARTVMRIMILNGANLNLLGIRAGRTGHDHCDWIGGD
jgi:hypothetical protein